MIPRHFQVVRFPGGGCGFCSLRNLNLPRCAVQVRVQRTTEYLVSMYPGCIDNAIRTSSESNRMPYALALLLVSRVLHISASHDHVRDAGRRQVLSCFSSSMTSSPPPAGSLIMSTHHRHSRKADLVHSPARHVGVEEERHAKPYTTHEKAQGHCIGVEYTHQRHCVRLLSPKTARSCLYLDCCAGFEIGNLGFTAESYGVLYPGQYNLRWLPHATLGAPAHIFTLCPNQF